MLCGIKLCTLIWNRKKLAVLFSHNKLLETDFLLTKEKLFFYLMTQSFVRLFGAVHVVVLQNISVNR